MSRFILPLFRPPPFSSVVGLGLGQEYYRRTRASRVSGLWAPPGVPCIISFCARFSVFRANGEACKRGRQLQSNKPFEEVHQKNESSSRGGDDRSDWWENAEKVRGCEVHARAWAGVYVCASEWRYRRGSSLFVSAFSLSPALCITARPKQSMCRGWVCLNGAEAEEEWQEEFILRNFWEVEAEGRRLAAPAASSSLFSCTHARVLLYLFTYFIRGDA